MDKVAPLANHAPPSVTAKPYLQEAVYITQTGLPVVSRTVQVTAAVFSSAPRDSFVK